MKVSSNIKALARLRRCADLPEPSLLKIYDKYRNHLRGPPRGFGEQGYKGIYFRGRGEQRPNFEGNRGTKTILGNREHKKKNCQFFGNRGTRQFISREQGNR